MALVELLGDRLRPLALFLRGSGRDVVVLSCIRTLGAVTAYGAQVVLARNLSQTEYGIYSVVFSNVMFLTVFLSLGFDTLLLRKVDQYRRRDDLPYLNGLIFATRGIGIVLSGIVGIGVILLLYIRPHWMGEEYKEALFYFMACLPLLTLNTQQINFAIALKFDFFNTTNFYLVRNVLLIIIIQLMMTLNGPVSFVEVLMAILSTFFITSMISYIAELRIHKPEFRLSHMKFEMRDWTPTALAILYADSMETIIVNISAVALFIYVVPEEIALYYAGFKVLGFIIFVDYACRSVSNRSFARTLNDQDQEQMRAAFMSFTRINFFYTLIAYVLIVLSASFLLGMLGQNYLAAWHYVVILGLPLVIRSITASARFLLVVSGLRRVNVRFTCASLAVVVVCSFTLTPLFGMTGIIMTSFIMALFDGIYLYFLMHKHFQISVLDALLFRKATA